MAKDDYEVIVYQVLAYLYNCLKNDIDVDPKLIEPQGKLFNINSNYWSFILSNLFEDGYIDGIIITNVYGKKYPIITDLEFIGITPKGIQFLVDNSFINKVVERLKDAKSIVPFI